MNKKLIAYSFLGVFVMSVLVTAGLVSYLSNTVTGDLNIESPITISVDGNELYTLDLYAGQSVSIESLTEVHVDGVTGHIAEIKIPSFDGEGITVEYRVDLYPGYFEIPVCVVEGDAYFYIGDPTETLDNGSFLSTTTFNTVINLDTDRDYNVETRVIMADKAACESIPSPNFIAD